MAITAQRNRSKTNRKAEWYLPGSERREQRLARLHATKKNSKRKRREAQFVEIQSKITELKASNIAKAKEAARKLFDAWLEQPTATKWATEVSESSSPWCPQNKLLARVKAAFRDIYD